MKRAKQAQQIAKRDWVPIEQMIDYKIGQLRKLLDRYSSPAITEQFGLSLAEWRIITHIRAGSSVTAIWLGARLQADRAEISRASASLIERGLVASKPNPADGRSVLLELTEKGRRLYDQIMPARQKLQRELMAALSRQEAAALYAGLDRLTKTLAAKVERTAPAAGSSAKSKAVRRTAKARLGTGTKPAGQAARLP